MKADTYKCNICSGKFNGDDVTGILPKFKRFDIKRPHKNLLPDFKFYYIDLDDEFYDCKIYVCQNCLEKCFGVKIDGE